MEKWKENWKNEIFSCHQYTYTCDNTHVMDMDILFSAQGRFYSLDLTTAFEFWEDWSY